MVINQISPHMPELIGGSADLTGSNNTKASTTKILDSKNYSEIIFIMALENMEWQLL